MLRVAILTLVISGLILYAFKDWYLSLCGLVALISVMEHPDMPRELFGIPGLNPWNILLAAIVISWAFHRGDEGQTWEMPAWCSIGFAIYVLIICASFARMADQWDEFLMYSMDVGIEPSSFQKLFNDYLVNSLKWLVPGFLLFDGCRTRARLYAALFAIGSIYLILSLQVIRWVPLSYALSGDSLGDRTHSILRNEIGFHRTDVAVMLAGGAWAIFALRDLVSQTTARVLIVGASMITSFGVALTAGRSGYLAWAIIGCAFSVLRWRAYILAVPLAAVLIATTIPGISERMMEGIVVDEEALSGSEIDAFKATAGRNMAWPFVVEKIEESPWTGWGRMAMSRTGISYVLWSEYGEAFPHPHNAYLEMLLDNGIIGALPVFLLHAILLIVSVSLLLRSSCPLSAAVGGLSGSLLIAFLSGAVTGQSFYPRETSVGLYCALGIMLRVYVENKKASLLSEPEDGSPAPLTIFARDADNPPASPSTLIKSKS